MANYYVIEQNGIVVHVSTKPVVHPNAREVRLPPGLWVVKSTEGKIIDLVDHFPLHPDAYWTPMDDPEVNQFLADQTARSEQAKADEVKSAAERAAADAQQRKRNALLDALIAKGITPESLSIV